MPRPLDDLIKEVLTKYGENPRDTQGVVWDCHGTWVVYHKALERVAARAGIKFDPPMVLEANGSGKCAALCVSATLGDRTDWSIGEAAPGNNKNSYPFAMAEKRARDRVILKLIGLAGLAYSEEEADDFKGGAPQQDDSAALYVKECQQRIASPKETADSLRKWWDHEKDVRRAFGLSQQDVDALKALLVARLNPEKAAA